MHILLPRLISNSYLCHGEPDSPSSSALTHFHLFPNLPTELRFKIWNLAIQPRVLEPSLDFPDDAHKPQFSRRRPPPALLSTTQESRLICLNQYVAHELHNKPFYIQPHLDILFISKCSPFFEALSYTEPFYKWLISQIFTLALEIGFAPSVAPRLLALPSGYYGQEDRLTPTLEENLWLYTLSHPSATIYLTFPPNTARSKLRSPPLSHSDGPCFPDFLVDQYADRTVITEFGVDNGKIKSGRILPDPIVTMRRRQMQERLKMEKEVKKNVRYMSYKVLRE